MIFFTLLAFIDIKHPTNNKSFSCFYLTEKNLNFFFKAQNGSFIYNNKTFTYTCNCSLGKKSTPQKIFSVLTSTLIFLQTFCFYPTFSTSFEDRLNEFKKTHLNQNIALTPHTSLFIDNHTFEGDSYPIFLRREGKPDLYLNPKSCRPNNPLFFQELEDFFHKNIPPCCLPTIQEGREEDLEENFREEEYNHLLNFLQS